jgi:two-component system cell cycle sensor histidine kinase/response regulator CckA
MSPQPAASPKTILLVDDDPIVVQALNILLTRRGYKVFATETLEGAISAARRVTEIDLLVVDAVMPDISGPELAEILLFLRPNMKILFITGLDGLAIHLAFDRPCAVLQKPFAVTALVSKIEEMLGTDQKVSEA